MDTKLFNRILILLSITSTIFIIVSIFIISLPVEAEEEEAVNIVYVNKSIVGGMADGSSWDDAYSSLQVALTNALAGAEIWVARGVYTPGETISDSFVLKAGVAIYGGFDGTETIRNERSLLPRLTVLSGDIDGDDDAEYDNEDDNWFGIVEGTQRQVGDNSYHVVIANGVMTTAVLDNLTITAGQADGTGVNSHGGGFANFDGNPTLKNVDFIGNYAAGDGGGMYNSNGESNIDDVYFYFNSASNGGGMHNQTNSSPTLTNVTFRSNSARLKGGGLSNFSSSPTLRNIVIVDNDASDGGGLSNQDASSPELTNVNISRNVSSMRGAGIYNSQNSHPVLTNVTISGNSIMSYGLGGGGIFNSDNSHPTIVNTIIWNNQVVGVTNTITSTLLNETESTPTISYSLLQGSGGSQNWNNKFGVDGGHNIDSDPNFEFPAGFNSFYPTNDYRISFRLAPGSPAIDSGNTLSYTSPILKDLFWFATNRIVNKTIDMGAYESEIYGLHLAISGTHDGLISGTNFSSNDPVFTCEATCHKPFLLYSDVILNAMPDDDSVFTGWQGDCTGTGECLVRIDAQKSVTATFGPKINYVFLPMIALGRLDKPGLSIGPASPIIEKPVTSIGEIFYSANILFPKITVDETVYLSSDGGDLEPVLIDDMLQLLVGETVIFEHDFSASGVLEAKLLQLTSAQAGQLSGQTVTIVFKDKHGGKVQATQLFIVIR